jgi:hypothetical protein
MMPYAALETLAELERCQLPAIFSLIARRELSPELALEFPPVAAFYAYATALRDAGMEIDAYLPLWEENGDAVVAYDVQREVYVRHYFLDRDLGEVILGSTYQQFVASVFLDLADTGFENLTELAGLFEFEHLPELEAFLDTSASPDVAATNRRFVASIGHGPM